MKAKKEKWVEVDIDLPKEHLYVLMFEAHKLNMTLNAFVNMILKEYIEKQKKETMSR